VTRLDFTRRSTLGEWMDEEGVDYPTFQACLVDLAKANRWTLAHRPTLGFLARIHRGGLWPRGRPLRFVDVGAGHGDLVRAVDHWAARRGLAIELVGVDLNPWAARAAAAATAPGRAIRWVTADALAIAEPADVIASGLFTHHLPDSAIVRFLTRMEAIAQIGWFINDLHRHPAPHAAFALLSNVMRWHPFVRHDGPISVARAFTPADWRRLIDEAGLSGAPIEVRWRFPFRLCVARLMGPAR
jgi:SAM-dependent methyltransferase